MNDSEFDQLSDSIAKFLPEDQTSTLGFCRVEETLQNPKRLQKDVKIKECLKLLNVILNHRDFSFSKILTELGWNGDKLDFYLSTLHEGGLVEIHAYKANQNTLSHRLNENAYKFELTKQGLEFRNMLEKYFPV